MYTARDGHTYILIYRSVAPESMRFLFSLSGLLLRRGARKIARRGELYNRCERRIIEDFNCRLFGFSRALYGRFYNI